MPVHGMTIAPLSFMENPKKPLKCFIAAVSHQHSDDYLSRNGFARGLILFSIPTYGLLFRCRADGDEIELEFGAFFALLRFISTRLKEQSIEHVQVLSSRPEFIFSFAGESKYFATGTEYRKMLEEYSKKFQIQVGLSKLSENQALSSVWEMPSTPSGVDSPVKPLPNEERKPEFRPFQKGLHL